MPWPTTSWGGQGNPLYPTTSTNPAAEVYPSVPGVTTTTPNSADGPAPGNISILADGTFIQFLIAAATIAANVACITSGVWQNTFKVTPCTAINQLVMAINDRTGVSVTVNQCTWFTTRGLAFPLVAASVAANKIVASSGTAGVLYAATPGTDLQSSMWNTVVVGGAQAASPVYLGN